MKTITYYSKLILIACVFLSTALLVKGQEGVEPYKNVSLNFDERADDLLSRLTLEEKALMLRYDSPEIKRLGIPAHNFWNECLHGVARSGVATVFPQAIGMAAMWDKEEMFSIADAISDEARAKHHAYALQGKRGIYQGLTFWTPNINIFRDPRWGRGMETYGEDPYLTGELAVPFIKGLQGDDSRYLKLVATAKHFAVHSGPESTRHSFDVWPSDYDLAETYLPHFRKTVEHANVYSVMCAYQRLKGAPCCGSKFLEGLLREQWGFEGYIVSDCGAIADFYKKEAHNLVATPEEAAAMAIQAGTDLNCGDVYRNLVSSVKQGFLTEAELDVSVKRIILARMKLGQFDPQEMVEYSKIPYSVVDSKEHKQLALDAAHKSIVLLKNEKNTLPFNKGVKKVAVIGPNADAKDVLLANYYGYPTEPKTVLAGLKDKLPNSQVDFAQGCPLAPKLPYFDIVPSDYLYTDGTKKQNGLKAEYFPNLNWEGTPAHTQIDKTVNFAWWTTPPFADLKYDHFSVRWSGVIVPPVTGEYAIAGEGLLGFDLYLDGAKLLSCRGDHELQKAYEYVHLEAGKSYDVKIDYVQNNTEYPAMSFLWEKPNDNLKQEALNLAKSSDIVVLCMGLGPTLEGEEMRVKVDGFDRGDRLDIKLPAIQTELIKEIYALGKPTVLVLLNGSALAFNWEAENLPAIVEAWYPGQSGGAAIADVLFGDYNPAGRLPVTFYRSIDQIPAFDDYNMAGKTYRYFEGEPLYEFGYGLSYTKFEYKMLASSQSVTAGDDVLFSVEVKNTGKVDGDEVVQLYVSLSDNNLKNSIRSLQGFKRIHLKAGESEVVDFVLTPDQMAGRDSHGIPIVAAGNALVSIGGKQPDAKAIASKQVIQKEIKIVGPSFYIQE
ncbi:glycoside hydrolase family 3 C-terminal domain-containing protein [Dysgonomonas sp. ZJ279]|uniref:glycoside hydrolase family 3 C-terminal domain-containing protein n=1 Tax=Dysgonomonas sp. ZJ279 TaxID=2709796 RepID=UPI0013EDC961|nr:glycoside hydrolase family 3 C-terminal domain-containing protein [Dysgonomonas sp. ZJ279]